METKLYNAALSGRCVTGEERGRGTRVHQVLGWLEWDRYVHGIALCGAKPSKHSLGWTLETNSIDCPKCLKKLSKPKDEQVPVFLSNRWQKCE